MKVVKIITSSSGGILVNGEGKVALVKDMDNIWMIPKGHVCEGEILFECAIREVFEETGLKKITKVGELDEYQRLSMKSDGSDDKTRLKKIKLFVFKTDESDLRPQAEDVVEARWFNVEDAVKILTHTKDKEILGNYFK